MDGGVPPLSSSILVSVPVTRDSQGPGPVFGRNEYAAEVNEGAAVGSSIITVSASSSKVTSVPLCRNNYVPFISAVCVFLMAVPKLSAFV